MNIFDVLQNRFHIFIFRFLLSGHVLIIKRNHNQKCDVADYVELYHQSHPLHLSLLMSICTVHNSHYLWRNTCGPVKLKISSRNLSTENRLQTVTVIASSEGLQVFCVEVSVSPGNDCNRKLLSSAMSGWVMPSVVKIFSACRPSRG